MQTYTNLLLRTCTVTCYAAETQKSRVFLGWLALVPGAEGRGGFLSCLLFHRPASRLCKHLLYLTLQQYWKS